MKRKVNIKFFLPIASIILIAFLLRSNGLDNFGMSSSDEYYIAKSVENIQQSGLPEYNYGGYYKRGLLYQYLGAFLSSFYNDSIYILRLISVLFNILTIFPIYLMVKKFSNRNLAIIITLVFSFSIWEIEISRIARFYAIFQFVFVAHFYFLIDYLIERNKKQLKYIFILSIISVFIYEESILIATLNFLILFDKNLKLDFRKILFPSIILLINIIYIKTDFRLLNVQNHLPTDVEFLDSVKSFPFYLPKVLFPILFNNIILGMAFIIIMVLGTIKSFILIRKTSNTYMKFLIIVLPIFLFLNLYGLFILVLVLFYLLELVSIKDLKWENINYSVYFILATGTLFMFLGAFSKDWHILFAENEVINSKKFIWILFNYPDFYQEFLLPWIKGMPIQTVLFITSSIFLFAVLIFRDNKLATNEKKFIKLCLFTVILMIELVCILKTPYKGARYTFFIYPLVIIIIFSSVYYLQKLFIDNSIRKVLFITLSVLVITVSDDISVKHLIKINYKEVAFRKNLSIHRAAMIYYKEDYKTPSEFINKNAKEGDLIVTTQAPLEYYLDRLDYYYRDYNDKEFKMRSRNRGKFEAWTTANLIYKPNKFISFLENSDKIIWLTTFSNNRKGVSKLERDLNSKYINNLVYHNIDSSLVVYKIENN